MCIPKEELFTEYSHGEERGEYLPKTEMLAPQLNLVPTEVRFAA